VLHGRQNFGYCCGMTEDKKITKKTTSKKSAHKKSSAQTKKSQPSKSTASKKPAKPKAPKFIEEVIDDTITSAALAIDKESEKLHTEMVEVIDSVINRVESNVEEIAGVNIEVVAVKSWIRRFLNKIRLTKSKKK
jgi:hypothetical protein